MVSAVAIDIGWFLTISNEADWDQEHVAHEFLNQLILRGISILHDVEGHIVAEYSRYLRETPLGLRFTTKMNRNQQVEWVSGSPISACSQCLEEIGFDPSDIPYIGAASRAGGVYLTHEEKHLSQERRDRILECCGVRIVGTVDLPGIFT